MCVFPGLGLVNLLLLGNAAHRKLIFATFASTHIPPTHENRNVFDDPQARNRRAGSPLCQEHDGAGAFATGLLVMLPALAALAL